jgi:hypothetical protein
MTGTVSKAHDLLRERTLHLRHGFMRVDILYVSGDCLCFAITEDLSAMINQMQEPCLPRTASDRTIPQQSLAGDMHGLAALALSSMKSSRLSAYCVQGRLSIPFKEVARSKRIKDNYALQGVRHGHLTFSLSWLGISDAK